MTDTTAHRGSTTSGHPDGARRIRRARMRAGSAVVARIAGEVARETAGVHVPDATAAPGTAGPGVSVEIGDTEVVINLALAVRYGESVAEITQALRRTVVERVQSLTGLTVIEVNILVDDVIVGGAYLDGGAT